MESLRISHFCLKKVSEVTAPCLKNIWNTQIISKHKFADNLKLADVICGFKKEDSNLTKKQILVSVLPTVSKILKDNFKNKSYILITSYKNFYVVIENYGCSLSTIKVIVLKLH